LEKNHWRRVWWERRKIEMKHFGKPKWFSFSKCLTKTCTVYNMTSKTLPGWASADTYCHLLEWGLLVDIINPGNVKIELGDADLILNKRFLPVLGGSLVFMITARSGYETVLKHPTWFFFKFYFHIFKTQAGFQKFAKNNCTRVSKCQFSNMWYQSVFKAGFHKLVIRNFVISKNNF
jgi:hypothetical protein